MSVLDAHEPIISAMSCAMENLLKLMRKVAARDSLGNQLS